MISLNVGLMAALGALLVWIYSRKSAAERKITLLTTEYLASRPNGDAGELDRFKSKVAHDVRSRLQTVLGYSQLLSAGRAGPLNEKQREYLDKLHHGAMNVLAVIDALEDEKPGSAPCQERKLAG